MARIVISSGGSGGGGYAKPTGGIPATDLDMSSVAAAPALTARVALNVRDFGAKGDGTTDDTAAIKAAQAAVVSGTTLLFPRGSYRVALQNPEGGAAFVLSGKSNVGLHFEPGAELLMDNLSAGSGTAHGILVLGAATNVSIVNARIRWATHPTARSQGDGFRFIGFPSDTTPAAGWTRTTGTVADVQLINCTTINAPQTGAVFLGCSDVRVQNFRAFNTLADGLHFNACRRVNVNGYTAVGAGDDGLAFVTYADPTLIYDSQDGPFYQPNLGAWSNTNSHAAGVVVSGGVANGVRISGSRDITLSSVAVSGKPGAGLFVDSAIKNTGLGIAWTYHASRGITVTGATLADCQYGAQALTQAINSASAQAYWDFDVTFSNLSIRGATNRAINVGGDGSTTSIISGVNFDGARIDSTGTPNPTRFSSLRNCRITGIYQTGTAELGIFGQDAGLAGGTSTTTLPLHRVSVSDITVDGGRILCQDLRQFTVGALRSIRSASTGIVFNRVRELTISKLDVHNANRANTANNRGIQFLAVADTHVDQAFVTHDATTDGTFAPIEIGGGDATNIAATKLSIEKLVYRNTLNASGLGNAQQGGAYGPVDFYARWQAYNGAATTPIWQYGTVGTSPTY